MFLYKGIVDHISIVKSVRLKTSLCNTLQTEVQPLQFRVVLDSFREACRSEGSKKWEQCSEIEDKVIYPNVMGEYVCGVSPLSPEQQRDLSNFTVPPGPVLLHLPLLRMQLPVDLTQPLQLTFLCKDLELTPKFRKSDGMQLRTAPPGWEGSRRVWRLQDATLVEALYTQHSAGVDCSAAPHRIAVPV